MRKMIREGNAYADNATAEECKDQRDHGTKSAKIEMWNKARSHTVEFNLKMFEDMLNGAKEA